MIEVNERIEVSSTPGAVWAILSNPASVVDCVEGAVLGDKQEDGSFNAKMTVKFGPAKVSFAANVLVAYDEAHQSGSLARRNSPWVSPPLLLDQNF